MPAKLKFTAALGEAICDRIARGVPVGVAAQAEGVAKSTLYEWRERGQREGEGPFFDFHEAIERALGEVESKITFNVIRAAADDWKAGAFWLKSRNREQYGEEVTVRHLQQGMQRMCDDLQPHMSASAFAEMLHAIGQTMGVRELAAGEAATAEAGAREDDGLH